MGAAEAREASEALEVDPRYLAQVSARFDTLLGEALEAPEPAAEIDELKLIVFSDQHRGARDGADDFQRSERAYSAALGYYLERGYTLYVLGDAEELWEEKPERVIDCYRDVLELEAEFGERDRKRLVKFFGNHDDAWERAKEVRRHLAPIFGAVEVRETLLLPLIEGDELRGHLFFAHGHQGTTESDRFGRWARLPVRYVWRPLQRKLGYSATTPATDFGVRGKHDAAMFEWARRQRREPPLVLVTGHTHRPVFSTPLRRLRSEEEIRAELADATGEQEALLRAELEYVLAVARDRQARPVAVDPPCYLNTGCCSFPDGDITGLEFAEGEARLVRWPDNEREPQRQVLDAVPLREVLAKVAAREPEEGRIREISALGEEPG